MKQRIATFGSSYRPTYYLTHPWKLFGALYADVKHFIQRGLYGYADSDTWSLDWYMSRWLPSALREMAANPHGCPHELYDAEQKGDECHKWSAILIEMADGFESYLQAQEDLEVEGWQERAALAEKNLARSFELMAKWFGGLWD